MKWINVRFVCIWFVFAGSTGLASEEIQLLRQREKELTKLIEATSESVRLYSDRGDVRFFLGQFDDAVVDYDRMIALRPEIADQHWRRGLALFFAGKYELAARQFDAFDKIDRIDRENGLWKFLSEVEAFSLLSAKKNLLDYHDDDRPPLTVIYRLFQGKASEQDVMTAVGAAPADDRDRQNFYADLYLGLHRAIHGQIDQAIPLLQRASENRWAKEGGGGPGYMRYVAKHAADRWTTKQLKK